ncbi:hypothetical protein F5Y16DRAFT_376042 [Xylariaceae sp. FL0255]|nr:hypothetical protein F5Y16DRAFT_376042 [Xylariaceae sp. FL0255]
MTTLLSCICTFPLRVSICVTCILEPVVNREIERDNPQLHTSYQVLQSIGRLSGAPNLIGYPQCRAHFLVSCDVKSVNSKPSLYVDIYTDDKDKYRPVIVYG